MHIEPGIVDGAKMALAYGTAAASAGYGLKLCAQDLARRDPLSFGLRAALAAVGTILCFEVLPHFAAGVSEVHFILGTTLFLILGAGPAAIGLVAGLLGQAVFVSPTDLPMILVNATTVLMPLFAMDALARRIIPEGRAYVDLAYADVLKLSAVYQGGIVAWVAFWVFYGQGFGAQTFTAVAGFGMAYMLVVLLEPVINLAVLAIAKAARPRPGQPLVSDRLVGA